MNEALRERLETHSPGMATAVDPPAIDDVACAQPGVGMNTHGSAASSSSASCKAGAKDAIVTSTPGDST